MTGAEAALMRETLWSIWDEIEMDMDAPEAERLTYGVAPFDALTPLQQLALLADVGESLLLPTRTFPKHTSINESAVAALYSHMERSLDFELDAEKSFPEAGFDCHHWRPLLLAALLELDKGPQPADEPALTVECTDRSEWENVIGTLADFVLWDADYEDAEIYVDKPPEIAASLKHEMAIDDGYFRAIPPDPRPSELDSIRERLQRLVTVT